ncbi:MAG: RagB/SusD family nutrient uptake outer membrane protein [Cyclobacteriaceae bacterium]|nr:RagB/SusD family nutrient uptake outer membrane protein [Cyclobacteriaceae bacterium HetDA_MAG_MS6]
MKRIFILLISVGLGFGCEDKLDVENPNEPNAGLFWRSAQDAQQGINAVYSTLHRGSISRWMPMLYSTRTDIAESRSPWPELNNALDKFIQPNYNFDPVAGVWFDNYVGINRANQVLDNVPDIDMDENDRNVIIGQAYMLRGLFYYHLVTLFGNVPLMLSTSQPQDYPPNSLPVDVYQQIISDLELAIDLLPETYSSPNDLGRVTRGAAHALKAKAHMQIGEYAEALPSLQWLVDGPGGSIYDLTTDYRDNFLISSENNIESVFEWQFEENPTEFTDQDTDTPNHNYGSSMAQFTAPIGIGFSDTEARRWIIYEFDELTVGGDRDPRVAASFLFDSTDINGPTSTMVYGQTFASRYGTSPNSNRVWIRKFLNDHWKNEEGFRSPNNYRYIRYADVLLMYAECLNATGSTPAAYQHVDRVRQRVGLQALSITRPGLSQAEFLEQVKHERLLELAGEGHRWNDLVRWGDLGPDLVVNDPAFANFEVGRHELLPIPQLDVDANPNLRQNPNW